MMLRLIKTEVAQHILEYAMVIALVLAAAIAMRAYVQRSARGSIKIIEEEAFKEPGPGGVGAGFSCDSDGNCPTESPYCVNGLCVVCRNDGNCGPLNVCRDGYCQAVINSYAYPCDPQNNICLQPEYPYCIYTGINVSGSWYQCSSSRGLSHLECVVGEERNTCTRVSGVGVNQCSANSHCISGTYTVCQEEEGCTRVRGDGINQCISDMSGECSASSHRECNGTRCEYVSGPGQSVCLSDIECGGCGLINNRCIDSRECCPELFCEGRSGARSCQP